MGRTHAHDTDLLSIHQEQSDISAEGSCLTEEDQRLHCCFSCVSLDVEDQCGGAGKEDTLNSPFLDVAIIKG